MRVRLIVVACLLFALSGSLQAEILQEILLFARPLGAAPTTPQNIYQETAKQIDTRGQGVPVVVFNPSGWTRTDTVDMESPFAGENLTVTIYDEKGGVAKGQTMGDRLYFTAVNLPAYGFKVYHIRKTPTKTKSEVRGKGFVLDNEYLSVSVNAGEGNIGRVKDKRANFALVPEGASWGVPEVVDSKGGVTRLIGETETVLMENGPAKARITFDHYFGNSQINQDVVMSDSLARIDLLLTVDWQESKEKELRFVFPMPAIIKKSNSDHPGAFNLVNSIKSASGQASWIELVGDDYGITVCTDFSAKFEFLNGALYVQLPHAFLELTGSGEEGAPEFLISFYPGKGKPVPLSTFRFVQQTANPLVGVLATSHAGPLGSGRSFLYVQDPKTIISGAKYDSAKDALTLTVANTGARVEDMFLVTSIEVSGSRTSRNEKKQTVSNNKITLTIPAESAGQITLYR